MLKKIFGPETDKVTGGWRWLHNEELHNLYITPNISRMIMEGENGRGQRCVHDFVWKA
jgi:hypothetical protein